MVNPMNVYIKQLAEEARNKCVEAGILSADQYMLTEQNINAIVKYFHGKLIKLDSIKDMEEKYPQCKGNSFLLKDAEGTFIIGYVHFSIINLLHELGHAFLELDKMEIGDMRGCDDINGGINELEASKFARAFLMPSPLFERKVIENSNAGSCDVQAVAKVFGIDSLQVVSYGRETYLWE